LECHRLKIGQEITSIIKCVAALKIPIIII